jgi:hypothetical protein
VLVMGQLGIVYYLHPSPLPSQGEGIIAITE